MFKQTLKNVENPSRFVAEFHMNYNESDCLCRDAKKIDINYIYNQRSVTK